MFETRNELEGLRWTGEIHIKFLLFCFCFWIQGRTFGQNRTNFCSHLMSTLNLAGRYYPYLFIFTQQPCRFIVCSLQPFSCRSQQFNSSLICAMPTHRRDKRARSRSPVALRPKSAPHSHSDRWTHRESNRQPETSRPQTPFNVFAQETISQHVVIHLTLMTPLPNKKWFFVPILRLNVNVNIIAVI